MVTSSVAYDRSISAAILAGGRARRLGGADKASLVVGGARIIERQLRALAEVTDDVRIVAGDSRRYADLGCRVIPDRIPGAGPLGGLYTALLDATHERVLVVACDLPFVTAELFRRLIDESAAGADAVVPRSARGLEPLCAIYARRCADEARQRIDRGELQMAALLSALRVHEVESTGTPFDGISVFENVNTPHDYARARGRVELDENSSEDRITE